MAIIIKNLFKAALIPRRKKNSRVQLYLTSEKYTVRFIRLLMIHCEVTVGFG